MAENPRSSIGRYVTVVLFIALMLMLGSMVFLPDGSRPIARMRIVTSEVRVIEGALLRYKELHTAQLPPCFAESPVKNDKASPVFPSRQGKLVYHLRLAWPETRSNAIYANYNNIRAFVMFNYQVLTPDGKVTQLDIDNLDQAEALPFWLGGFPTPLPPDNPHPAAMPVFNRKLCGFSRLTVHPFQLDIFKGAKPEQAMDTRWLPWEHYGFDFDEDRLQDADNDGWWEYIPTMGSYGDRTEPLPPLVYFEHSAYNLENRDPRTLSYYLGYPRPERILEREAQSAKLRSKWGMAVPCARSITSGNVETQVTWINPDGFQIIVAGQDLKYSDPKLPDGELQQPRIPLIPSGKVVHLAKGNATTELDRYERDNLTNFTFGSLQNEIEANAPK